MANITLTKHGDMVVCGKPIRVQRSLSLYGSGPDYHPDGDYFMGCEDVAKIPLNDFRLIHRDDLDFILSHVRQLPTVEVDKAGTTEWNILVNGKVVLNCNEHATAIRVASAIRHGLNS